MTTKQEDYLEEMACYLDEASLTQYRPALHYWQDIHGELAKETTKADIQSFIVACIKRKGLSPSSVHAYLGRVRGFLKWVGCSSEVTNAHYKLPRIPQKEPDILSSEEIEKLINALKRETQKVMVLLLCRTGLRVSECINLHVSDIRLSARHIFIHQGKMKKDRIVPISDQLLNELVPFLEGKKPDEWLFTTSTGKKYVRQSVNSFLENAARRVGITKNVYPHLLRHSFATHLIINGANVFTVSALMGHTTLNMTKRYTHIAASQAIAEVNLLDDAPKEKLLVARRQK